MSASMSAVAAASPLNRLAGLRLRPAKVVMNLDTARQRVGAALKRAIGIVGLTDKEAAVLLGLDQAQLSRQLAGAERVHVDRIYGTKLHGPFAIEQARDAEGCVIETTVTYRGASA